MHPFWLFMLIIDLLIPIMMIGFGRIFVTRPPKKINHIYGYRTAMSMKSNETWVFAHPYFGKWWFTIGLFLLPLFVISLLFVWNSQIHTIGTVGGVICLIQLFPLMFPVFPTEKSANNCWTKTDSISTERWNFPYQSYIKSKKRSDAFALTHQIFFWLYGKIGFHEKICLVPTRVFFRRKTFFTCVLFKEEKHMRMEKTASVVDRFIIATCSPISWSAACRIAGKLR